MTIFLFYYKEKQIQKVKGEKNNDNAKFLICNEKEGEVEMNEYKHFCSNMIIHVYQF